MTEAQHSDPPESGNTGKRVFIGGYVDKTLKDQVVSLARNSRPRHSINDELILLLEEGLRLRAKKILPRVLNTRRRGGQRKK